VSALDQALRERKVIVCVGSGGVGKTTLSAALGLRAAALGRKTIVCTIDPARRLANALGLPELGNVETRIDPARIAAAGIPANGELWALMLDLKRSWDEFIRSSLPADKAAAVLENRFYRTLSSALAGSQEYIAMEKLYQLSARGTWDLVILDTPPTAHALDFLDAPNRVLDFLGGDAARVLLGPALAAGRVGLRFFHLGGSFIARTLSKLTGTETLEELARFMIELSGSYDVFKQRAAQVKALLASDRAAFVLVTSPHAFTVDEAIYFHAQLVGARMPIAAVVANRVHVDPLDGLPTPTREALADSFLREGLVDGGNPPLTTRLAETAALGRALARLDERHLARLAAATGPTPQRRVPRFDVDVYDLAGLWKVSGHLEGT
jgi:anion-transporting  ArsA/GET3 family ATPase